uniref:ALOG domain-containing protein n=1 Tax=Strongyloides venezuelensis TaxID=75913 RepID=A0A0K0G448_STRVS
MHVVSTEPKVEVSGTKSEVVGINKKESTINSLELMKSVKTMEKGCNVEVFIKRSQFALAVAGLSPQGNDATSWLLMKLDQNDITELLKKLKNLVSVQNFHRARKDKDDRIRYEKLRQLREIPNLKNLGLIGRNFSFDELGAKLKI